MSQYPISNYLRSLYCQLLLVNRFDSKPNLYILLFYLFVVVNVIKINGKKVKEERIKVTKKV